jgi:apolipoprotein N-acyltransferase
LINAQEEVLNKLKNDFFYYLKDEAALFSGSIRADLIEKNHQFEIDKIYNSIVLLDRFGIRDFYDKRHLVPFGEYIPARRLFPFVNKITAGSIDFSSGETGKIINNKNFNFFPIICYEAIFPLKFDKKIRELKPNIIINLTNDGWFGNSSGPRQHFDMTKARAIENSIPLIRVSNSGISAYIDGYGNVIDSINLSERGFFDAKILKETTPSFYFNYGNYSLIIFLIILILLLILTIKRNDEKL